MWIKLVDSLLVDGGPNYVRFTRHIPHSWLKVSKLTGAINTHEEMQFAE